MKNGNHIFFILFTALAWNSMVIKAMEYNSLATTVKLLRDDTTVVNELKNMFSVKKYSRDEIDLAFRQAADRGYIKTMEFLLSQGAYIDARSPKTKFTPLMAITSPNRYNRPTEMARLNTMHFLLKNGAAINATDLSDEDNTVLKLAASVDHNDTIVALLLSYGADVGRAFSETYRAPKIRQLLRLFNSYKLADDKVAFIKELEQSNKIQPPIHYDFFLRYALLKEDVPVIRYLIDNYKVEDAFAMVEGDAYLSKAKPLLKAISQKKASVMKPFCDVEFITQN